MKKQVQFLFLIIFALLTFGEIANAQVTFDNGPLYIRVDDYGAIRVFTLAGTDTVQHINRISLIAAGNEGEVMEYWNDLDVEVETELVASPTSSDYEITGAYNNSFSGASPNFLFEQSVYGWNNASYIVVKCVITNRENSDLPTKAGIDVVQYVDYTWEDDKIFYDVVNNVLTQFDIHYVGIKILSEQTTSGQVFEWFDGYEVLDTLYYSMMNSGTFTTDTLVTDADGGVGILGGEQSTLASNATKTVYFAVAVGSDGVEMLANMQLAQQKYNILTSVESDFNNIPNEYVLNQNYPNPFNPTTDIKFSIPTSNFVTLKIYDVLGNELETLVNQELQAGTHIVDFNASLLSSGTYFYRITSGSFSETKKMTLIK
ncbi:MAG: T9SS type A sorting domain-containing protein [Ignavibacteriaceae bacterium]